MTSRHRMREPATSNTPAFYVVLGGGKKCGVYSPATLPFIKRGYDTPALPVVVLSRSHAEAQHVHRSLADFFVSMEAKTLTPAQIAGTIYHSSVVEQCFDSARYRCDEFYPVLFSKEKFSCIYLAPELAHEKTRGHQFAKWGRVDSFAEALCWMVLKGGGKGVKGQTFKPFDLLQFVANDSDIDESDIEGSGSDTDGDSDAAEFANLQRTLEHITLADRESRTSPRKKMTPATHALGKQDAGREDVRSPAVQGDPREAHDGNRHTKDALYPWLAKGTMDPPGASWADTASTTLGSIGTPDTVRGTEDFGDTLFIRLRALDGSEIRRIGTNYKVLRCTPVPSLGPVVDSVLTAFGYDSTTCYYLWHAYVNAAGYYSFCKDLIDRGVSVSEASWYWDHIIITTAYRNHTDYKY